MSDKVYSKLARHLDELPGGFPSTESGVELRILKRLFTPKEAGIALATTMIPEKAGIIARRTGLGRDEAERRLQKMVQKGLIFSIQYPGREALYMASQYVIGIWEYQVNNLDKALIRDMNAYLSTLVDYDNWKKSPQLRTIPVQRSIDASLRVLPHEMAEELVKKQRKIRVFPCICRKEHTLMGHGCDKPEESCIAFGMGAYYYEHRGIGRDIDVAECLEVLKMADKAGLVLQPTNAKKLSNICCCCGCCCQVLINLGKHPKPAELISTPFMARLNSADCNDCGACEKRCQMGAVVRKDERIELNPDRCIGCGLCVSTCPTGSLTLERKANDLQPYIPSDTMESRIRLAKTRGKLSRAKMTKMSIQSKWDRWLAKND